MTEFSILHPRTCGFVKIAAFELLLAKTHPDEQVTYFRTTFGLDVKHDTVRKVFPKICDQVKKIGKRHGSIKNELLQTFSKVAWEKLSVADKCRHTVTNCAYCVENFHSLMMAFPVHGKARCHNKDKAKVMDNTAEVQKKTLEIYQNANAELNQFYPGVQFNDALVNIPELHLQRTPSGKEKQQQTRKIATSFKNSVEKQLRDTAVRRTFGLNLSLSKSKAIRMVESSESKDS